MLLSARQFNEAEKVLRQYLVGNPLSATGHSLLARSLAGQEKDNAALAEALQATGLEPDSPEVHYVHGLVRYRLNQLDEAQKALRECLSLSADHLPALSLLAWVHIRKEEREAAFEYARRALELDPEDDSARTAYTFLLRISGKTQEALEVSGETLRLAPHDSYAHSERGWSMLSLGDIQAAQDAFRESLRLNPNNESARQGIIQSIKAKNLVFRLYMHYTFWLQSLPSNARWGFNIALFFLVRLIGAMDDGPHSHFRPYVQAVMIAYGVFIFTMWTADPLFNVLLFLHPVGRHALNRYERTITLGLLGLLVLAVLSGLAAYALGNPLLYLVAVLMLFVCLPFSALSRAERPFARFFIGAEVALLLLAVMIALFAPLQNNDRYAIVGLSLLLAIVSTWINSLILSRER